MNKENNEETPERKPIKMVKITGHIPTGVKSMYVTLERFEVPVIESIMFSSADPSSQFPKEAMDKVHPMSQTPLAPMVGAICQEENLPKMVEEITAYFTGDIFRKILDAEYEAVTEKGIAATVARFKSQLKKHAPKKRSRVVEVRSIIAKGKVIEDDITGLSMEQLKAKDLKDKKPDAGKGDA